MVPALPQGRCLEQLGPKLWTARPICGHMGVPALPLLGSMMTLDKVPL